MGMTKTCLKCVLVIYLYFFVTFFQLSKNSKHIRKKKINVQYKCLKKKIIGIQEQFNVFIYDHKIYIFQILV